MPFGGALTIGATALGVGESIAESITGAHKLKKDKEELAKLNRPFYKIQDEYFENKNLTAQNAMGGLPQGTKDFETSESQRGLSASIDAILKSGGRPEDISKAFDTFNRHISRTGAEDAERTNKNIDYYIEANKSLAGQKNIQFGVNELQPYESKLKEITERRKADEQSIWNGVKGGIGAISAGGTALSNQDLMKAEKGAYKSQAGFYDRLFGGADPFTSDNISSSMSDSFNKD